jgi:4-amino-4-deoxy-L-arabinose transferase-like glycosyltransferase
MLKNNNFLLFIILGIVAVLIHLPFLGKAFHIDDTLFYYTAKQILTSPLDPYSFHVNWTGNTQKAYSFFSNPPGISYYIAFIIHVFGANEKVIHASYILFSLLSIFSMYFLAKRFTKFPFVSTLLLVFSPIYIIMAHTIMPDLPLVAFFLLSITLFIYGSDRKNMLLLILSGIAASIAILMRYNGLSLIPILLLYYLLHLNAEKKWHITIILVPAVTFIAWNFFTKMTYGNAHFLIHVMFQNYLKKIGLESAIVHLVPHFLYLGGGTIFTLFFFVPSLFKSRANKAIFIVLGICTFATAFYLGKTLKYNYIHTFLASIFLFSILYFLLISLKDVAITLFLKKRMLADDIFLLLWIVGILVMHNSGIHSAAKYMITAVPPLIILIMKNEWWLKLKGTNQRVIICVILISTGAMGLVTAIADYEFANANRKITNYCVNNIKTGEDSNIWFLGHWGFQYYMEKKGFKPYEENSNEPKGGDFLVCSSLAWPQRMSDKLKSRLSLYDKVQYRGIIPIRIMHNQYGKHANFYSYSNYGIGYGILPFSISTFPIDEFKIYHVAID